MDNSLISMQNNPKIQTFLRIEDTDSRYEYLIKIGKEISPISDDLKTEKFLVKGCISQAWLIPSYQGGKVRFQVDSEALIVKGIMAVLLEIYNGMSPKAIIEAGVQIVNELKIPDLLSMNRRNGLSHMLKQIQMYAIAYKSLADQGIQEAPSLG